MKENEKLSLVDLGKRLLEASRNGQADVVKELMQNGAPFTTDWLGTSPLHLAAQHGHTQTAEQLLRSGVSRDARTKVDRTPLHMAAQNGHLPIVELLISFGACVNNRDMLNMTPLHWACEYNHSEIIKALLQAGAQNDIVNKFGKTPLDIAGKKCAIESVALLSAGQIHEQSSASESKSPLESNKRLAERATVSINSVKKRQRTKKFPMTAGSWTGSDATPVNIGKSRKRSSGAPAALNASGNTTLPNGRRLSAQTQYQNAGSPSLRSPTENSIASLVSAAELVKSKAEAQQTDATATTSQDSSVLDTLATLATATLSHNTGPTPSSTTQHVTAISGRGINVAPLTLTTGTASHAASALTTPLTPSTLFPLQSPLAALSALTSLSTPTQTSPLPNIAMSPLAFQMPVNLTPQQLLMSGTQLVSSVAQQGSVPSTSVMSTAESSNSTSSESANLLTSIAPAQLLTQPFLAYTGGGNTGHFLTQIPQGQAKVEHDNSKTQDSAEQKTDDSTGQQTQEVYVTVQVPSNIPTVQSQQIGEHNFTLQPVIVQPGTTGDQNLLAAQTVGGEKNPEQPTSTTTSHLVQVQLPPGMVSQSPGQFVQLPGVPEPISIAQLQHLLVNQNMAGTVPQVVISPQKIQLAPSSPLQQVSTQAPQPSQAQAAPSIMPQQSQQQQQISQQLMQQSIPQGLLHQSAVAPVELQQSPLPHSIPSQVFLQVQEDFRKLIEQQKVEEERQRKELEEKVITLEQHSKKYRSELEIAQKAAETYRDQLQAESRERARLSQLYESPKKGSNNTASTVVESAQK